MGNSALLPSTFLWLIDEDVWRLNVGNRLQMEANKHTGKLWVGIQTSSSWVVLVLPTTFTVAKPLRSK